METSELYESLLARIDKELASKRQEIDDYTFFIAENEAVINRLLLERSTLVTLMNQESQG